MNDRRAGALLHKVKGYAWRQFNKRESARGHINHRQVRIDARHHGAASERVGASLHKFGLAFLGHMRGHDKNALHARDQIHGAANGGNCVVGAGGPIGQVAVGGNLQRAQYGKIKMAAANHGETCGLIKERGARHHAHAALAGVDEFGITFAGRG